MESINLQKKITKVPARNAVKEVHPTDPLAIHPLKKAVILPSGQQ